MITKKKHPEGELLQNTFESGRVGLLACRSTLRMQVCITPRPSIPTKHQPTPLIQWVTQAGEPTLWAAQKDPHRPEPDRVCLVYKKKCYVSVSTTTTPQVNNRPRCCGLHVMSVCSHYLRMQRVRYLRMHLVRYLNNLIHCE